VLPLAVVFIANIRLSWKGLAIKHPSLSRTRVSNNLIRLGPGCGLNCLPDTNTLTYLSGTSAKKKMFDDIDSRTLIHLIATQTSWTATIGIPLIECLDVAAFITGPWAQCYKTFYNCKLQFPK
jgi:hypothetical protein